MIFDPNRWKFAGEAEATNLLYRLAIRNPDVLWHVIGKSSGQPDPKYTNIKVYWKEDTPKSAWGVLPGGGGHMCNHCKNSVTNYTWELQCCDKSKAATEYERYLMRVSKGFDGFVAHLGQHGTSHNFIPKVASKGWDDPDPASIVRPYVWAFNYGGYFSRAVNEFMNVHNGQRNRMVWLCADPRNYMNGRDIKWPSGLTEDEPILAQYQTTLNGVHERWRDPRSPDELGFEGRSDDWMWRVKHHYRHSGLDMQMLPDDWENWPGYDFSSRKPIGVVSTAAYLPRRDFRRSAQIADWVMSNFPDAPVYGKWDERSLADLPDPFVVTVNKPSEFPSLLGSLRSTVILPPTPAGAEGTRWCTAKPWQAFAARTVAFMIPPVDAQGWVIPASASFPGAHEVAENLWSVRDDWTPDEINLAQWLRPSTPEELATRVNAVNSSQSTWEWLTSTQHALLTRRWNLHEVESKIEERLKLG